MDEKLLLVKSICLIYRESQQLIRSESSVDFIRTGIERIQVTENTGVSVGLDTFHSSTTALKTTVIEMCNNGIDYEYDKDVLLQTLKSNAGDDDKLYEILEQGIITDLESSILKKTISNLRRSLDEYFRNEMVQDILNKANYAFKFKRNNIKDVGKFIIEVINKLEPFQLSNKKSDPAILESIDIGDINSINTAFESLANKHNSAAIMQTGWQSFNRMLQGGFRRGEMWCGEALQHQWKTGLGCALFAHMALYNTPHMIDPTKKPLLVKYTFEDAGYDNIGFLYQYLHLPAGTAVDDVPDILANLPVIDRMEMARFVQEKLSINGYHIKIKRVDPTNWSYLHLINDLMDMESDGYEIHHLSLDYLAHIPTTGCTVGAMGDDVRDLFRRIRNFSQPRKIFTYTPHQLSSEAKNLAREGRQNFLASLIGMGFTDKCKRIDNELDGEILTNKECYNRRWFLNFYRGKHRGVPEIEERFKSGCLPFPRTGHIPPDIGFKDISLSKPGAYTSNQDEDNMITGSAWTL